MTPNQYCTVLNVANVISTNILGFTFWGASVEFITGDDLKSVGIVYFLNKDEALNMRTGNKFLR